MAANTEYTPPAKNRPTQMEMSSSGHAERPEDYDRKLKDAQEEMDRIQQQREELERQKLELAEQTNLKHSFVSQQAELCEKLTSALTLIGREVDALRSEMEDIEQCGDCFTAHLEKIQKFNPENWVRENLAEKHERATMVLALAQEDFEQAATHYAGTRSGAIIGRPSKHGRPYKNHAATTAFMSNLCNGFAFNLPILVLGSVALLVFIYLSK